jgi:chromate reductase
MHVIAISGSLRAASFNTALIRAARRHAPHGIDVTAYQGLRELPPYDQDQDRDDALPSAVRDLREQISAADALLIATPEYNYGVPGVLKNALDWASRPSGASSLTGKPVAIMGAAPTNFGSVRAQLSLRQLFLWTDSRVVVKPEVAVFRAQDRVGADGEYTDPGTIELVQRLLESLRDLVELTGVQRRLHAAGAAR